MNFREWLNFYDGSYPFAYLIDNKGNHYKVESGSSHVKLAAELTGKPIIPPTNKQWVAEPLSFLMKEGWIRVFGNNFHVFSLQISTKKRIASFLLEIFGKKALESHDAIIIEVGIGKKELFVIGDFMEENL